jgi:hypothetical protein
VTGRFRSEGGDKISMHPRVRSRCSILLTSEKLSEGEQARIRSHKPQSLSRGNIRKAMPVILTTQEHDCWMRADAGSMIVRRGTDKTRPRHDAQLEVCSGYKTMPR